jgi:hypothetical protein
MNRRYIATKLNNIENAIKGALDNPRILSLLILYGYTNDKITVGKKLLEEVIRLTTDQILEYGNQYGATDEQEMLIAAIYAQYMIGVKITRVAFKDQPDILAALGVVGARPRSFSGWIHSARIFYTNLLKLPSAIEIMSDFGYTEERLRKELQDVENVEEVHVKQLKGKSAAQQATKIRDEAFDKLCNWYSDFRAVARIALYNEPQLLEALGIKKK